jgi:hypothetical protein
MACQCLAVVVGYAALAYLAYKMWNSFYSTVFPYLFAVPQNLQVLAGAKWAGGFSIRRLQ